MKAQILQINNSLKIILEQNFESKNKDVNKGRQSIHRYLTQEKKYSSRK